MIKATIIYTFICFLHLQQSRCDVQSISWYFLGSEGLSLPRYTESVTVNDVTVFYYDSNMKSTAPCPEWLNTTAGQQHWKETSSLSYHNMANMALALQTAKSQFNLTGLHVDINVYQGYSRCDLYPDGTTKSLLTHAFNGKDFLSLDVDSKTYIVSVPQALKYKSIREKDIIWLESVVSFYKKTSFDRLRMSLEHAPGVRNKKDKEEKPFRLYVRITLGCIFMVTVFGLLIRGFCCNKEDTETEYTNYNVTCNLPQ